MRLGISLVSILLFVVSVHAQTRISVQTTPQSPIQPTMWGIFFEDINFAADGGLYAELVKNRSFEFDDPLTGWKQSNTNKFAIASNAGTLSILQNKESGNQRYARIKVQSDGFSVTNEGFRGMGVKQGTAYTFSVLARQQENRLTLHIELGDSLEQVIGSASIQPSGSEWKKYTATLTAKATQRRAHLTIRFEGTGTVDLDMISLFPNDTWRGRPGGLRSDLVQLLADLKPGFIRFPGGCIVEGRDLQTRYQWKKTVGQPEERELIINRWNTEFKHRPTPDYFQTFGLGFFEYFQLAEDVGAEPLPILNCGMACQFNTAELVPMNSLDPYIQDALDLIEFANGDPGTLWGRIRTTMGHEKPFNLKYIGVGNEQWGPEYIERYKEFSDAIRKKYPEIKLISAAGPGPDGELFEYASSQLRGLNADLIDEHYYSKPEWFLKNAGRYDTYNRKGPRIFAGEFAAQSVATVSPENKNTWLCALSEAAFMTGLERNADLVTMASYAPLFAHVDAWQWTPDLIWFDNLSSYGTPNYYVQKAFSTNKGTHVLSATADGKPLTGQSDLYASAVYDNVNKQIIIKVVNASDKKQEVAFDFSGTKKIAGAASVSVISGANNDVNSLADPKRISPKEQEVKSGIKKLVLEAKSLTVAKVPVR